MPFFRTVVPIVVFASAVFLGVRAAPVAQNVYTKDMDRSIQPGDDFYRYASGGWLKAESIPAGQSSFDNRAILTERTGERVRSLMQDAATAKSAKGRLPQKVGDYYTSFMDEAAIESKGLAPLSHEMATIAARRSL